MEKRLLPVTNTRHPQVKGPSAKPSRAAKARLPGLRLVHAPGFGQRSCRNGGRGGGSSRRSQQPGSLACVAMDVHPEAEGAPRCSQPLQPTSSAPVRKRGVRNA